jgi:hypothetical protein
MSQMKNTIDRHSKFFSWERDGICFGPRAQVSRILKTSKSFVSWIGSLEQLHICVRLHYSFVNQSQEIYGIRVRVHFLPDLKVGVSMALCTPIVMKGRERAGRDRYL